MKLPLSTLIALLLGTVSSLSWADPASRVGRISSTQGMVTFRNTQSGDMQPAALNWPLTSDNELITDGGARAEFRVGSAAVRLDGNSDLEILRLDDRHFMLRLNRGSAAVMIRNPDLARDFSLDTSQGHILLAEPTSLRVDARYDMPLTALSVSAGSASFDGGNARFSVQAGQYAEVADGNLRLLQARSNSGDGFDGWVASREREDRYRNSARYVSAETTGYEELDNNGSWQVTSQYGPIWSPRAVALDWAPYRDGRWTWVAPWGWTWVDNAPWGYAPSHYGRWVFYDQRWCWTPGALVAQPIWAPALVGWVGGRSWQVGFSTGSAPAVGWFPLAPRDVYMPGYQVSPQYIQQINNTTIINNNNVTVQNNRTGSTGLQTYQNQFVQNAVTVMPQSQFSVSKTVMVAPTMLEPRQVALLRSAPVSAVTPLINAPRAVSAPAAPSYQQRPTPALGPVMRVQDGRNQMPQQVAPMNQAMNQAMTQPMNQTSNQPMNQPLRNQARFERAQRIESSSFERAQRSDPAMSIPQHAIAVPMQVQQRQPSMQMMESAPAPVVRVRPPNDFQRQPEPSARSPHVEMHASMPAAVMAPPPSAVAPPAPHAMPAAAPRPMPAPEPNRVADPRQRQQNAADREGNARLSGMQQLR